ncbi:uncharacterized protein MELLADRAFT_65564 [Melampsora larici-populina 98AG31]|uniref:Secreted protein n=1 Tax=Melampsora larici-populina (strain 98AG31 / pathotype 3-4-7) TaxID=747676 RepID=F4RVX0_MELLP|nr:uncharacterized protein MELLADRAFT_65564 [Melampsora larici-populina 98AG31]EGG03432.1 hypothetical protein MELLADRAFT_65564 [Melampsora larici-populina 98AG31]
MPWISRWLGALQVLLLSSLSIQMDHTFDFDDLSSSPITKSDSFGDIHLLKAARCKRQKIEPQNRQSRIYNLDGDLDTGKVSLGPKCANCEVYQAGNPSLDLSLNSLQGKSSSLEKFKGIWVKTEDMNDPFHPTEKSSRNILKNPAARSNEAGSGKSWLNLGQPENGPENLTRNNLKKMCPHVDSVGSNHQCTSREPWLTLGHQHNVQAGCEGRKIEQVDPGTSIVSASFKQSDIESSFTKISSLRLSPHNEDGMGLQSRISSSSSNTDSSDPHHHHQINLYQTNATKDQKGPHTTFQDPADSSQDDLNNSGAGGPNKKHKGLVLEKVPHAEVAVGNSLRNSQSLNKTKSSLQQKNSGRPAKLGSIDSEFDLAHAIKSIAQSKNVILKILYKDTKTWFSRLRDRICEKGARENSGYMKGGKNYVFVTRATSEGHVITTLFLNCMKLLHRDEHSVMPSWEHGILVDGWTFIQQLFNQWMSMSTDLQRCEQLHRYDHIDELQPEVLFNYLKNIRQHKISPKFLWSLWKRWYRDSKYSEKIFLATEEHFIMKIQQLNLHNGHNGISKQGKGLIQRGQTIDNKDYHQNVLQEHILQFHKLTKPSPFGRDLVILAQHIGRFELDLLEHHEPVTEWLESLLKYMVSEIHVQDDKKRHAVQTISNYVKTMYYRVIPIFLGILKLMEDSNPMMGIQERDTTVSDGWEFMKYHLGHWRKIDIGSVFGFPLAHPIPEDHKIKESYNQFKGILSIGNPNLVPLKNIHRLYYLKNAPANDVFDSDTINAEGKIFQIKLQEIYSQLQNVYLSNAKAT